VIRLWFQDAMLILSLLTWPVSFFPIHHQWRSQGFDPGGHKIFFGAPHVRKFFDDLFFTPSPPIFPPAPPAGGGGRRTSRTRGAIPSGKGARGHDAPLPPWLRHCSPFLSTELLAIF
jgi:hypothetical protein